MRGRRQIVDAAALAFMAQFNHVLVDRGEAPNDLAAARAARLALNPSGASESAIEDRLRTKFRDRRAELMARAAAHEFSPIKSREMTGETAYLKSAVSIRG